MKEEDESDEHPLVMAIMHRHKTTADMANTLRIVQSESAKAYQRDLKIKNSETLALWGSGLDATGGRLDSLQEMRSEPFWVAN